MRENHALERSVASEGNSCFRKVCCKSVRVSHALETFAADHSDDWHFKG